MLSSLEHEQLLHDIKRAAHCLKIAEGVSDIITIRAVMSLLIEELDRLAQDIQNLKPKDNNDAMRTV